MNYVICSDVMLKDDNKMTWVGVKGRVMERVKRNRKDMIC